MSKDTTNYGSIEEGDKSFDTTQMQYCTCPSIVVVLLLWRTNSSPRFASDGTLHVPLVQFSVLFLPWAVARIPSLTLLL